MKSWPGRNSNAAETSRGYVIVTTALVIGFVAGIAYKQTADEPAYEKVDIKESFRVAVKRDPATACNPEVVTQYFSSDLEQAWLDNAAEWEKDYCNVIAKPNQQRGVKIWMDTLAKASSSSSSNVGHGCDPTVFSR